MYNFYLRSVTILITTACLSQCISVTETFILLLHNRNIILLLQVFSQFPDIKKNVSLHMVEVSPKLSSMQAEKLSGQPADEATNLDISEACYRRCTSKQGIPVSWYRQLSDVPRGLSVYVAHEFFDALPIHKFQVQCK